MRYVLSLVLSLVAGIAVGWVHRDADQIIVFSVGQGDCALIRSLDHAVLIDDGPLIFGKNTGLTVQKLRESGVNALDAILLSHADADHTAETRELLQEYPGVHVVMSDQFRTYPAMIHELSDWHLPSSSVVWLPQRSHMQVGKFSLLMLCPPFSGGKEDNNGSMFVRVSTTYGLATFSGDAPDFVEKAMEPTANWHAEVLHVGHHGSRTSTGESWIQAVEPSVAVISVGRNNSHGHPTKETLDRLEAAHVPVLRTDRDGDLVFDLIEGKLVREK
ncbi:MAG TPA: MBL fold metallo-hydrolase [Fimbriimonas sp.]|nr:MBL fold metallo-hydrolase [Fimbriimonas sp.]